MQKDRALAEATIIIVVSLLSQLPHVFLDRETC